MSEKMSKIKGVYRLGREIRNTKWSFTSQHIIHKVLKDIAKNQGSSEEVKGFYWRHWKNKQKKLFKIFFTEKSFQQKLTGKDFIIQVNSRSLQIHPDLFSKQDNTMISPWTQSYYFTIEIFVRHDLRSNKVSII